VDYHGLQQKKEHFMASDFLSQVLGSVLGGGGGASGQPGLPGGLGGLGGLGGSLGNLGGLGGMLGNVLGGASSGGTDAGGKGAMLAMLLPLVMQMIQRNGGVGAMLDKFKQQGLGQQVNSWVSTGANQPVSPDAVTNAVGSDEVARMAQQLGVPEDQVAGGLAHILPHVVNHLTPGGDVPADADDTLNASLSSLTQMFGR
jgi:uncharacterized protein YidB (DUF937 family)